MNKEIELLAPGGDILSIKAAILAGADAIYCGLDRFNARNRAANISFDELPGIIRLAHKNDCKVFLTLNIIIVEREFPALIQVLNSLTKTSIDGVIIQDLGLFYLISKYYKSLLIHASTQLTTHNEGQIKFLSRLSASRVNLSRELNIKEIKELNDVASKENLLTEVFVHGSYCISFSGICYMSSVQGGNSGNRGRCSQPCRDRYLTTPEGKNYPLNLKDNSAYPDLKDLYDAGVYSLKIEGRIKKYDYVYTVVKVWQEHIRALKNNTSLESSNSKLHKVFNRDFTNSYMKGEIGKGMFIDNPRDNTLKHLTELSKKASLSNKDKDELYKEKEDSKASILKEICKISTDKEPLDLHFSAKNGEPLKVRILTPGRSFKIESDLSLSNTGQEVLDRKMIMRRFKALNDTEYFVRQLEIEASAEDLFIPFKELTALKNKALNLLNRSEENLEPIQVPALRAPEPLETKPELAVLISSPDDLYLSGHDNADIHYHLPANLKGSFDELIDIFSSNRNIIPWFPPVLIGEEYSIAVEFLQRVKPASIVTNNSGIAFEAFESGLDWVAGPMLNIVNSYSLKCLKEKFNCSASFISNEINRLQIKNIKRPENFELYYSIYHPILLMTSRMCLFQQTEGCEKEFIDRKCIPDCKKSSSITNLNNETFYIDKKEGDYNNIYNPQNFLNTEIVSDFPDQFSKFFVDLRNIGTQTKTKAEKQELVGLFENLINKQEGSQDKLKQTILHTTNTQYNKGI